MSHEMARPVPFRPEQHFTMAEVEMRKSVTTQQELAKYVVPSNFASMRVSACIFGSISSGVFKTFWRMLSS